METETLIVRFRRLGPAPLYFDVDGGTRLEFSSPRDERHFRTLAAEACRVTGVPPGDDPVTAWCRKLAELVPEEVEAELTGFWDGHDEDGFGRRRYEHRGERRIDDAAEASALALEADDPDDFQPVGWFQKNTDIKPGRLRQAANRPTKGVRTRVVDGVTRYSVSDCRRNWPHDMRGH